MRSGALSSRMVRVMGLLIKRGRDRIVSGAVVPEPVVREAPAASPPSPWALMIGFWLAPILLSMSLGGSIKASFETKQSETEPPNRP